MGMRIDKWVWSVRLFPSRTKAASACRAGRVKVDGHSVAPSHSIDVKDRIEITGGARPRIVEVEKLVERRVGSPIAVQCYLDHSPPPPPKETTAAVPVRDRGAGRPTKRERREIDRLRGREL